MVLSGEMIVTVPELQALIDFGVDLLGKNRAMLAGGMLTKAESVLATIKDLEAKLTQGDQPLDDTLVKLLTGLRNRPLVLQIIAGLVG